MIKKTEWKNCKDYFKNKNFELFNIINEIKDEDFFLYEADYEYGQKVMENGIFNIPYGSGVESIKNIKSNKIIDDISYNNFTNPLLFIGENSIEIFKIINEQIVPHYGLIKSGEIIGTWPLFEENKKNNYCFFWDITAGSRSSFVLPNIGVKTKYELINEKFNTSILPPNKYIDHFDIFKEIYKIKKKSTEWKTKLFIFPKIVYLKIKNEKSYSSLKNYFLDYAFKKSIGLRNSNTIDLSISVFLKNTKYKYDYFLIEILKDIINICIGNLQSFSPCYDEEALPVEIIRNFFEYDYKINHYPTIMSPSTFDMEKENQFVYYSIDNKISNLYHDYKKIKQNKIEVITQLIRLINDYLKEIEKNSYGLFKTNLNEILNLIKIKPFHSERRVYGNINKSSMIPEIDNRFKVKDGKFCDKSKFLNGCIQISTCN